MKAFKVLTHFLASALAVSNAFTIRTNSALVTTRRISSPPQSKLNPECRKYIHSHLSMALDPHSIQSTVTDAIHGILSTGLSIADAAPDTSSSASSATDFSLLGEGNRGFSYYSTLALYALSFPGLWSTIKRSTNAKIKQKTYVSLGEAAPGGKSLRQQAAEIMACK